MTNKHRSQIEISVIKHVLDNRIEQLADCLTKQGAKSLISTRILEKGQLF